jgi:hypothetical protein
VLAAFLNSTKNKDTGGTHYFYLAFSNNCGRYFAARPRLPGKMEPMDQGAAFIVDCVKKFLEEPVGDTGRRTYKIRLVDESTVPTVDECLEELLNYLNEKFGTNAKYCFHVDEHRQMCYREESEESGASFSRGAMQTLAQIPNATVIGTYTDIPREVPPIHSSTVCRLGIPLPPLDMDQVMEEVPELLSIINPGKITDAAQQRLLASLKLRLGLLIRFNHYDLNIVSLLHSPEFRTEVARSFLHNLTSIENDLHTRENS